MKKVIVANIGGKSFTIDEDAFAQLKNYFDTFRATIDNPQDADEVMEDIEVRAAEILREQLQNEMQSVNCTMVSRVIAQLGTPEGAPKAGQAKTGNPSATHVPHRSRRLYRDIDNKMIGGVCSGIAAYLNVDAVVVRLITLFALILGGTSFWVYIILWVVVPAARTVAEKLEMRGEPVTAENIKNSR